MPFNQAAKLLTDFVNLSGLMVQSVLQCVSGDQGHLCHLDMHFILHFILFVCVCAFYCLKNAQQTVLINQMYCMQNKRKQKKNHR